MEESASNTPTEILRRTLLFRSWHRGTREMDMIMGSFAEKHLPAFSEGQLKAYEAFLKENDPDIYDWYCGRLEPDSQLHAEILALLRGHVVPAAR